MTSTKFKVNPTRQHNEKFQKIQISFSNDFCFVGETQNWIKIASAQEMSVATVKYNYFYYFIGNVTQVGVHFANFRNLQDRCLFD